MRDTSGTPAPVNTGVVHKPCGQSIYVKSPKLYDAEPDPITGVHPVHVCPPLPQERYVAIWVEKRLVDDETGRWVTHNLMEVFDDPERFDDWAEHIAETQDYSYSAEIKWHGYIKGIGAGDWSF